MGVGGQQHSWGEVTGGCAPALANIVTGSVYIIHILLRNFFRTINALPFYRGEDCH